MHYCLFISLLLFIVPASNAIECYSGSNLGKVDNGCCDVYMNAISGEVITSLRFETKNLNEDCTFCYCIALDCTSMGLKLIAGQSVGTETIRCDNSQAYCYNMSANAAVLIDIVKVGCSMWRCMLARDRCISTTFQNIPISLCCCSTNLCNVPENRGIRQQAVQGWNAQPDREQLQQEERWTKQQFGQFNAVDLDDDTLNGTVRGNLHSSVELDNGVHNGTFRSNRHRVAGSNEDLLNSTLRSNQYSSEEIQIP